MVISKSKYLVERITATVTAGEILEIGTVTIRAGDVNGDNSIDLVDLTLLATAYRAKDGVDSNYDARCDFNEDGTIDLIDLTLMATNYRQTGD